MTTGISQSIIALIILVIAVYLVIVVPIQMAKARNRSAAGWLFISLIFTPVVAIIALMVLGRALPESRV